MKLCKIQSNGCCNEKVIFISSQKNDLLKYVKVEFQHISIFFLLLKKDGKVFGKYTVRF